MNLRKGLLFAALVAVGQMCATAEVTSFPIGTTWPDTKGEHINCHGGCVVPYDGQFYWFGESRTGFHSNGISVYRSSDLYNWENLGMAAVHQGVRDDVGLQDISDGRLLERPKVVYNARTGKWVMWAHWENGSDYGEARVAILQADKITGPYSFVSTMRPNGHDSRDMTVFLDTDGNAYHFCSTNMNTDINVVRLADDFLSPSKDETMIMKGRHLEATTVCKVDETYFATFSECNGWDPAPGHSATAVGDPLGTWTEGLNFCSDDEAWRSYRSQGAFVFSVGSLGYDPKCFVFYGDRWNSSNVGGSTYVWLPLSVRSGYPVVRNYATWNLDEVMRDMYRYKRADAIRAGHEYSLLERRSDRLVSRLGRQVGFCVANDGDTNLAFTFEATADPYVWKLRDAGGLYLVDNNGQLRSGNDAGAAASWRFVLLPDGYYNVINEASGRCLTVQDESRLDGATLTLAYPGDNAAQAFCPYFDSKAHADYKEAPMYTKAYFERVAADIKKQDYKPAEHPGEATLTFEASKPYAVMLSTADRALTFGEAYGAKSAVVADFDRAAGQKITFVAAPAGAKAQGYNITDGRGNYLAKEGKYNTTWGTDVDRTAAAAIFTPEKAGNSYVLRCADNGRYLGVDATDQGAAVYSDKQGTSRRLSLWRLADYATQPVKSDEEKFVAARDVADLLFSTIDAAHVGEDPFDISATAYNAFRTAVDRAFAVTAGWAAAKADIEAAVAAFNANRTVLPDPDKAYYIMSGEGLALADDNTSNPCLVKATDATASKMKFSPAGDGIYLINGAESGRSLAAATSDAWSTTWLASSAATDKHAQWEVSISRLGGKVLRNIHGGNYLGYDDASAGAHVYYDKKADAAYSQWRISASRVSGVGSVAADAAIAAIAITAQGRTVVVVSGAPASVALYTASGAQVAAATGRDIRLTAAPGLYIAVARTATATRTAKLLLR